MNDIDKRNPYIDKEGNPVLHYSVVAFVDILGYSELVKEAESQGKSLEFLMNIYDAINCGLNWLLPGNVSIGFEKDMYRVKVFTDNVVIGYPIFHHDEPVLGHVFDNLGHFQLEMANHGFFIRGGLTLGDIFIGEHIIYGKGLIEAYQAEVSQARDPRIVLTDNAVNAIKEHMSYYAVPSHAPQCRDLFIDVDGQYFINYLDAIFIAEHEHGPYYEELLKHKKEVEYCLDKYRSRPTLWTKYEWVAKYHNYFCDLHNKYFNAEQKINTGKYEMTPRKII